MKLLPVTELLHLTADRRGFLLHQQRGEAGGSGRY